MKYYLMNKDSAVGQFDIETWYGSKVASNFKSFISLPFIRNIHNWLEHRQVAIRRPHIRALMKQAACDTLDGFIRVTHCTSINDTLWVKQEGEAISWSDVSLYTNEFDTTISRLAFIGNGDCEQQTTLVTPEFSIGGSYPKCVVRTGKNTFALYKRCMDNRITASYEPYCEMLSSDLYSIITDGRSVRYELDNLYGRDVSRCEIFTNQSVGLLPYRVVSGMPGLAAIVYYEKYDSADLFRAMLVADAVCFNEDRHSGNHGVLYDNDTLEVLTMAPVYDNNVSLLPHATMSDLDNADNYLKEHNTKLGFDWVGVARNALTPHLRSILINLKGYEFKYDGCDKFPKERVKKLEWLVNRQIDRILN